MNVKPFAYISINGTKYPLNPSKLIGKPVRNEAGKIIGKIIEFDIEHANITTAMNEGESMPKIEFGVEI